MKRKTKRPELKQGGALKAYPTSEATTDAWWYANKGGVEVVAVHKSGATTMARVRLSDILKRVKR